MIHRHLDVTAGAPVAELPLAALYDLLERGDLDDWRPLLRAIQAAPVGELANRVSRLVDIYPMYGTSPLFRSWIERCRHRAEAAAPRAVGTTLASVRRGLGKTQAEVARRMGISQSDYSKLERRTDARVSTLAAAARALGGDLRLVLSMPGADRRLRLPPRPRPARPVKGSRVPRRRG